MKRLGLVCIAAAMAACTTTETAQNTRTDAATMNPDERRIIAKRSYSQDHLRKTGEPTTGAALEKSDPSVYISGNR